MDSAVTGLIPELLLKIFELLHQDGCASVAASSLCCRRWRLLAESVLYSHVFLDASRLRRFLNSYNDRPIRSLTVFLDAVRLNPFDATDAIQTLTSQLEALRQLHRRLQSMALVSLSITLDFPVPYTGSHELSLIVTHLPNSCTCLEIDFKHTGFAIVPQPNFDSRAAGHLCDAIRAVLPRLEHLRLRYPLLCPALFSKPTGSEPIHAPKLITCLINLSLRAPTGPLNSGSYATPCSCFPHVPHIGVVHVFPSALPPLLPSLRRFTHLNSTHLKRLQVIDLQTRDPTIPNSWAAWVRRDFLSQTSVPIPVTNIGINVWFARVPPNCGNAEDWLSSLDQLEALAEGRGWFWNQTGSSARLVTSMLREHDFVPAPLTKEQYLAKKRFECTLWQNEKATGARLLPEGPAPLMEMWDLRERTPRGWTRDNAQGSPMLRKE